jgi:hypothetical protein
LPSSLLRKTLKYECETLSPTLREECILKAFKKRVLRVFGLKREELTGG